MTLFSLKKITPLLLTGLMVVVLTACQGSDAIDTSTTETVTTESESTTEAAEVESTTEPEPFIVEDFELIALDGTKTNLYAYEGQIIVLNFWATWCGFCVEEMPLLDEMDKRDDITVIAISVGEEAETVKKYIEDGGYDFDVYLDKEGTLASKFGVTGFPTSLFLGKDFEYFYSYPGMLEQDTFDSVLEAIDEIVKERSGQ
jgi:thiol-disulfide isomerase/thioredoxin